MVVEYRQADDSSRLFGYMMSDGPLSVATGRLVKGFHNKCYWIARKRSARGDQVTGRVLSGTPTAYDIDQLVLTREDMTALGITAAQARERSTIQLTYRLKRLREVAEGIGRGVGDPTVQEAFWADEHGGQPYAHEHLHRLEMYQLIAHLEYAHGLADIRLLRPVGGLQDQHAELHARASQDAIRLARQADGEPDPRTTDWRTQYTADIE